MCLYYLVLLITAAMLTVTASQADRQSGVVLLKQTTSAGVAFKLQTDSTAKGNSNSTRR